MLVLKNNETLITFSILIRFNFFNARVVYIVNHGRINIEERCQDGKAIHQIWHMDVNGKVQKLNLKGHKNKYFKIQNYPK